MASLGAALAVTLLVAGCDSAPAATPPADAAAKTAAPATPGPKRLEAKRPSAPKQPDTTAGLMNPGDEVEGVSGKDSSRAAARTKPGSAPVAPADVSAAPGARARKRSEK